MKNLFYFLKQNLRLLLFRIIATGLMANGGLMAAAQNPHDLLTTAAPIARQVPPAAVKNVEQLSQQLCRYSDDDFEKVAVFFMWICRNIRYDDDLLQKIEQNDISENALNFSHQAPQVLSTGKAVCVGYSNLLQALCDAQGIACRTVIGSVTDDYGILQTTGHAWNVVKIQNVWYLIDNTWAAVAHENIQQNDSIFIHLFAADFFLASPKYFLPTHYPDDPMWQLVENPVTKAVFLQGKKKINKHLRQIPPQPFSFNDTIAAFERADIHTNTKAEVRRILQYDPANSRAYAILANYYIKESLLHYDYCTKTIENSRTKKQAADVGDLKQRIAAAEQCLQAAQDAYLNITDIETPEFALRQHNLNIIENNGKLLGELKSMVYNFDEAYGKSNFDIGYELSEQSAERHRVLSQRIADIQQMPPPDTLYLWQKNLQATDSLMLLAEYYFNKVLPSDSVHYNTAQQNIRTLRNNRQSLEKQQQDFTTLETARRAYEFFQQGLEQALMWKEERQKIKTMPSLQTQKYLKDTAKQAEQYFLLAVATYQQIPHDSSLWEMAQKNIAVAQSNIEVLKKQQ